jgi:thiamine-phosphate pyrophosphorylase
MYRQGEFQQIAISNWGLYQSCHKTSSLEAYSDYLAGLISGGQPGGCPASGQWQAPNVLIIREKALEEAAYLALFQKVWEKSNPLRMKEGGDFLSDIEKRPMLIPHTYVSAARQAGTDAIHLPFALFQKYHGTGKLEGITHIGVSIHAPEEAARAQELGAAYVTAGHIFATGCKPGLAPRGIPFLEQVCASVSIPVYAIGGIHWHNLPLIRQTKASGACMMSEYMHIPYVQTGSNML